MAKILESPYDGHYELVERPGDTGGIPEALLSAWAIEVYGAHVYGMLFPRNPLDVYDDGIVEITKYLRRDPDKQINTRTILLHRTDHNDRKCIKAERENHRAIEDSKYDPALLEETLADKHEPNVLERQAIARRNLRVLFARLSAEEVADLQAWMQEDCNFTDAAKVRGLPTQTYRDHMQKHFAKMLGMCKKLRMEGSLDEIL